MLKITKEKIENYRYENNLPAVADEWLQDVVDFNKVDKLQEFVNFNNVSNFEELENILSDFRNQEEIASQLELDY